METAIIFGAGKTGRGFAAHLAFLGGYEIILIDKNLQLINDINKARQYDIEVLGYPEKNCTIPVSGAMHIDDIGWHDQFVHTRLVFTSVFGNNLENLSRYLAAALELKYDRNRKQLLTIITCENLTNAAGLLREKTLQTLGSEKEKWLSEYTGFSESIIFRTCLDAAPGQSQLTIRAQNFFELPCDADAIKGNLHVYGLKPLANFSNQLRRKIYTYNCINAVISYLGAKKGYFELSAAGNDPEILETAWKAARETSSALVAEYGFDQKEQDEWTSSAFEKFADRNIPDPIERNAADPVRKLGREDRLIGPALLALKHNIFPEGLLEGIIACFEYANAGKNCKVADIIRDKGVGLVLKEICGLSEDEALSTLIKKEIEKKEHEWKVTKK